MTEAYLAEHLWFLTGAVYAMGGQELNTPRYTELIDPEGANTDNRTAQEIKDDIVRKLLA